MNTVFCLLLLLYWITSPAYFHMY